MSEAITSHIFNHLVELASLELSEEEAEYLRRELNGQMKAIRELEAIQIADDVPITSHGVTYTPEISAPLREDRSEPWPGADDILAGAPQVEGRYVVVPDIPHEDLS